MSERERERESMYVSVCVKSRLSISLAEKRNHSVREMNPYYLIYFLFDERKTKNKNKKERKRSITYPTRGKRGEKGDVDVVVEGVG